MGRKGLLALVAATVVAGLVAWGLRARSMPTNEALPERVFPGLAERLNDVTALTVETHDGRVSLRRTGQTWGADEKDGHPVRFDKLRSLLLAMSELKPLERKTATPALHAKLGLQPPQTEGSTSTEIVALDAGGAPLADLIVGQAGNAPRTHYVRKGGDNQTWLVQGDLNPVTGLSAWLDTEILRLDAASIERVTTTQADGEVLSVVKQAKEDPVWTIEGIPDGSEAKSVTSASGVTGALQWLDFDDVATAAQHPLPESDRATSVFETWDGLRITIVAAKEPAPAADAHEDHEGHEAHEGGEEATTPPGTPPAAADWIAITVAADDSATPEAREQAAKLNARVAPWVYKLGTYKASTLRQRLGDLIQPKPTPPADPAMDAPPDSPTDTTPDPTNLTPVEPSEAPPEAPAEDSGG